LDHFSRIAPYYDRIFPLSNPEPLLAYVRPEPHHRLLDVGGGTGRVATYFVGRVAEVCILDPSAGMLQEGQRKGIRIAQGECERLPFGSDTFSRAIVIDTFHHLRDPRVAARELMRVLGPDGRLVVQEPDIAHWGVKAMALAEKALLMRSRFYALGAVRAMFEQAGGRVRIEREAYTGWVIVEKRR
jgi:demethylmenaquinone methyltransferase/2-methoxy-6-polyprenyl-1,4-benzoquinol methylase